MSKGFKEIQLTNEELGKLLFKRLELKYEGQLDSMRKKFNDFENLVFSWERQTQKELDEIKIKLKELNPKLQEK